MFLGSGLGLRSTVGLGFSGYGLGPKAWYLASEFRGSGFRA